MLFRRKPKPMVIVIHDGEMVWTKITAEAFRLDEIDYGWTVGTTAHTENLGRLEKRLTADGYEAVADMDALRSATKAQPYRRGNV